MDVTQVLQEIQVGSSFQEFGDVNSARPQGYRTDIALFKRTVDSGVISIEHSKVLHPNIVSQRPGLVLSYIHKVRPDTLGPPGATDRDFVEWVKKRKIQR